MAHYEGIIVFNPPPQKTFSGEPVPGSKEWFELSRADLDVMLPTMNGTPLCTEHGGHEVGRVLQGYYTPDGHAAVRFSFHDDEAGRQAKALVEKNLMRGLSLCHESDTKRVKEVSICFQGARPHTGITHIPETKPPSYNTPVKNTFVEASLSRVWFSNMAAAPHVAAATTMMPMQQAMALSNSINGQMPAFAPYGTQQQWAQGQNAPQSMPQGAQSMPPATQSSPAQNMPQSAAPAQQPAQQSAPQNAPPTPTGDDANNKKRKVEETDQDAGDSKEDIIMRVMRHAGALSTKMKEELIQQNLDREKELQRLRSEVSAKTEAVAKYKDTATRASGHFFDTLIPFISRMLSNEISPEQKKQMMAVAASAEAQPFLDQWAAPIVRASAIAMEKLREQETKLPGELSQKLEMYRLLSQSQQQQSASPYTAVPYEHTAQAAAARLPPVDVAASYGWYNAQPGASHNWFTAPTPVTEVPVLQPVHSNDFSLGMLKG